MYRFNKMFSCLAVLCLCLMLTGCEDMLESAGLTDPAVYPYGVPADHPAPPKSGGSIYQEGYEVSLYQDSVARHIGDVVTIKLEEVTQGHKKSKTKTTKSTADSFGPTQLFGRPSPALNFNVAGGQDFNGEGEANQENKLQGTVSVTVVNVLSNNNLVIQGESWLTLTQGREYIRLSGIIRPQDINPDNTVSSQRIANARIAYTGNGQVGNVARGGIITQLITKYFPF
jgi:flagellar L-ring protein precursor FlgH